MIDCSKCPEKSACCGIFRIGDEFLEKHKDKFQVACEIKLGAAFTDDLLCVFLNRKTRLCAVYENRPDVCKLFGTKEGVKISLGLACPHFKPNGNDWSPAMKTKITRHLNKSINKIIKETDKPQSLNT